MAAARISALWLVATAALSVAGCARGPSASHAGDAYRGKLSDDTLVEASTVTLVTTKAVVVAMDCRPLERADGEDAAAVDRAVAAGSAVRLPPGVLLYTMPFSAANPGSSPLVVTDDRAAGRLCTGAAYTVEKP